MRVLILLALFPGAAFAAGLKFEAEDIKGKIQKPEIQILISKQNLTPKYELELRESFLPKVIEAVEHKPF
ncbi:MAG: hypothetical protein ACOZNI_03280 [Myxococcota bacterium]